MVVTRGGDGCKICTPTWSAVRRGRSVDVVDTVRAGDTFTGAMPCGLHDRGVRARTSLRAIEKNPSIRIVDTVLATAAIVCERQGVDPP